MSEAFTLNDKRLKELVKAFSGQLPVARVGILGGGKNKRAKAGGLTNAEIGAIHEYGTAMMPMRSFLRMPITLFLAQNLQIAGAFTKATLNEVIRTKSILPWMQKVALTAEGTVLDAFATGGFGRWKPSNMKRKQVKQTLVESQQLRDAITSDAQ